MTEEKFETLEQYLKERVSGEHIDVERETKNHRRRFRENASQGDQFAIDIMKIDDTFESLPVEIDLAENFGIGNPKGFDSHSEPLLTPGEWVSESDVEKHIKEYYTKIGFGFSGYGALGFLDFKKGQEYLSVNLTWTPWNILVSVHDKGFKYRNQL